MAGQADVVQLLDELVRLQAWEVRRRADSQVDAIRELDKAGFGPKRIAEVLGTTPNTVNVAISREKKRKTNKPAE